MAGADRRGAATEHREAFLRLRRYRVRAFRFTARDSLRPDEGAGGEVLAVVGADHRGGGDALERPDLD